MTPEPSFIPGFIALAVGALAALWFVLGATKRVSDEDTDTTIGDLEERAHHFMDLLRDLKEQEARLDADTFTKEKARLEQLAAESLRHRDDAAGKRRVKKKKTPSKKAEPAAAAAAAAKVSTEDQTFFERNPQFRGFAWGVGTVGIVALLFYLVNTESMTRAEGQSMTGNAQGEVSEQAGSADVPRPMSGFDVETRALVERISANPDDVDANVKLAQKMLISQNVEHAKQLVDRALSVEPKNKAARTYNAWITAASGSAEAAQATLTEVLAEDSTFAEAWFFKGMIHMQTSQPEESKAAWKKFVEHAPDGPQKQQIQEFLRSEGGTFPARAGGARPGGAPPQRPAGRPPFAGGGGGPFSGGGGPFAGGGGGPPEAILRSRLDSNPNDVGALVKLSRKFLMRNPGEAKKYNDRALQIEPKNADAQVNAAMLRGQQGDPTGAISALDTVLVSHPKNSDAWFFRGMLGMLANQMDVNRESWEKFVEVAPDGPRKENIKSYLAGNGLTMPGAEK